MKAFANMADWLLDWLYDYHEQLKAGFFILAWSFMGLCVIAQIVIGLKK
jgi:hypothetical protein